MLQWITDFCVSTGDVLLGWLLHLSPDVVLLAVAAISTAVIVLVRPFTTNQNLLGRVSRDKKRLKKLVRQAKSRGDRDALRRHRQTFSLVGMVGARSEGWPLLAVMVPILLLATWCLYRLEFRPPGSGDPFRLLLRAPISMSQKIVHLVPQPGVECSAWVTKLEPVAEGELPYSAAAWEIQAVERSGPYCLTIRHGEENLDHEVLIGQTTYSAPLVVHDDRITTELEMKQLKLFGLVPGIPWLLLPPWLVAYMILVIPLVVVVKRVSRIY